MFPHYMHVAGWLGLAAVTLAWIAITAYLTFHLAQRSAAPRATRGRWIVAIWVLPIAGVAGYLVAENRSRSRRIDPG